MLKAMRKPSLFNTSVLLNFAIVLALLLGSGLKQFSASHDPAHYLQKDVHCAVCISSLNLDNGVSSSIPSVSI
ncbi:MAG: hypothetical protein ACI88A_001004, partial [Paraglaciecola sp.]